LISLHQPLLLKLNMTHRKTLHFVQLLALKQTRDQ